MAYSSTNPPAVVAARVAGAPSILTYQSTHTLAAIAATSFFSNGAALGMRVGDILFNTEVTTAGAYTGQGTCRVTVVTAGAGATVTCATTST